MVEKTTVSTHRSSDSTTRDKLNACFGTNLVAPKMGNFKGNIWGIKFLGICIPRPAWTIHIHSIVRKFLKNNGT